MLSACQSPDSPESMLDNYLYRLRNSLQIDEPLMGGQPSLQQGLPAYPRRRDLLHAIPPSSINILAFLRLSSCDLQRHIGQRNSSLGSLMKGSQRLIYEYEFIRLAEKCLLHMGKRDPLYAELQAVLKDKYAQLPKQKWNAIAASEEFSRLFSLGSQAFSRVTIKENPVELYTAIDTLQRFSAEKINDAGQVETAYSVLASSKYFGELRLSMRLLVRYMLVADRLLDNRSNVKPLCFAGKPNKQSAIVKTVFLTFYIGEVQPYIAKVNQQAKKVFEHMDNLVSPLVSVPAFDRFWLNVYTGEDSEWQQFNQAIDRHTKKWQQLLGQCGLLPA